MEWKDLGKQIAKFAPLLGTALGGPAVGGAVALLSSTLGLNSDEATPEKIESLIGNPEIQLKLKELEVKHRETLEEYALRRDLAHLADVANARSREVETTKATGQRDTNLYILAWSVVGGFFILCIALMRFSIPKDQNEVIFMLFGALAAGFGTVLQYFFGSSRSSREKTQLLTQMGGK